MFSWEMLASLLQVGAIVFAAGGVFISVRNLDRRMLALENAMKQLVTIMVTQGRHEERMNAMDNRMLAQGKRLDDYIETNASSLNNMARMVEGTITRVNTIADGRFRNEE